MLHVQTVKQMWPYICQYVEKVFREAIEPAVKESNSHLSTFCFSRVDIGDKVSASLFSHPVQAAGAVGNTGACSSMSTHVTNTCSHAVFF